MSGLYNRVSGEYITKKKAGKYYHMSFANSLTEEEIVSKFPNDDIVWVEDAEKPQITSLQVIKLGDVEQVDSMWYQTWNVVDMFEDSDEATKEEQEAEYVTGLLEKSKVRKQNAIDNLFSSQMSILKDGVSQEEVDTFPIQEEQARAYVENNEASVPFIEALAEARGISVDVLVPKIIAKADAYRAAVAVHMGNKHKLRDLVRSAEDIENVEAIIVE